jgi:hypothetical protein
MQALYRILAKPSLRLSRSISASCCDAWDETTFHPLNATSTTIHVSIGNFFKVIVRPSHSCAELAHLGRGLWRHLELSLQRPALSRANSPPILTERTCKRHIPQQVLINKRPKCEGLRTCELRTAAPQHRSAVPSRLKGALRAAQPRLRASIPAENPCARQNSGTPLPAFARSPSNKAAILVSGPRNPCGASHSGLVT